MVINMGDRKGFLIEYILEGILNILKDHLTCQYDTWDEFRDDIFSMPMNKIKHGKEMIVKEKARDTEISSLKSQVASMTTLLQAQTVQLMRLQLHHPMTIHTGPYANQPTYQAQPTMPGNAMTPAYTPGWQPRRPPLTHAALLERFATVVCYSTRSWSYLFHCTFAAFDYRFSFYIHCSCYLLC